MFSAYFYEENKYSADAKLNNEDETRALSRPLQQLNGGPLDRKNCGVSETPCEYTEHVYISSSDISDGRGGWRSTMVWTQRGQRQTTMRRVRFIAINGSHTRAAARLITSATKMIQIKAETSDPQNLPFTVMLSPLLFSMSSELQAYIRTSDTHKSNAAVYGISLAMHVHRGE